MCESIKRSKSDSTYSGEISPFFENKNLVEESFFIATFFFSLWDACVSLDNFIFFFFLFSHLFLFS